MSLHPPPPSPRLDGTAPAPVETAAALKRSARLFDALGDPTRLSLVSRLSTGEALSIARLTEGRPITRQAVAKHLRVLKRAGVVRSVRHGRERHFILELQSLDRARRHLDLVSRRWDEALGRLKVFAETREEAGGAGSGARGTE
jgi:DNA-binding transcriptional ArsR family regulator